MGRLIAIAVLALAGYYAVKFVKSIKDGYAESTNGSQHSESCAQYSKERRDQVMYCQNCGSQIPDGSKFCATCGAPQTLSQLEYPDDTIRQAEADLRDVNRMPDRSAYKQSQPTRRSSPPRMQCPYCGGVNISVQTIQENLGGQTVTRTTSQYKEKRHGCLWWLLIGWWWWMIDLFLWVFMFIPRVLLHIGRRKKYVGKSTSVTTTNNRVR